MSKAAGVSATTVSRYLNRTMRLPEETARRIDQAVAALQYAPDPLARSFSRGRSETIGLVLPEIDNPFFARLAASVEAAAAARGYGVLLCATLNRLEREFDYIRRLDRNHVDGMLFVTNHPDDGRLRAAVAGMPRFVLIDEDIAGADLPGVFSDNAQGARDAARLLIEAGHRKLAMLSGPTGLMSAEERKAGFLSAIRDAGPGCEAVAVIDGAYTAEAGAAAAETLLRTHPEVTAIFVGSDEIFLGLLPCLRRRGLRIGTDISVVTCDDVEPLALFDPPITAVRQNVAAIGAAAFDIVMHEIAGTAAPERRLRIPMEVIRRASVAPPPA
ncbi:MAG TPA: LacI family DNA-binding transcriptional regulator [Candidatus Sulfotelmatobacter sp.]|nr:LacI family DNA-binding transcriptional regulator [Candidatus Sulfotelmatobacter sp.]